MGPHGIPRSCQLSSQSCNGGSLEAQLSDRPADRPHTQTRPGCAHRVVLLNESRDLAGVFATYPAPYCATGTLPGSRPRARVDHLHHHAPVALCDHPTTRAASTAITGLYVEHQTTLTPSDSDQMEALQTDEQITPITTIKRHAAAGRVRHRPRSLKTAGVEVRSSPGTSTSTRNPQPTPTHPHSTRKSRQYATRRLLRHRRDQGLVGSQVCRDR